MPLLQGTRATSITAQSWYGEESPWLAGISTIGKGPGECEHPASAISGGGAGWGRAGEDERYVCGGGGGGRSEGTRASSRLSLELPISQLWD